MSSQAFPQSEVIPTKSSDLEHTGRTLQPKVSDVDGGDIGAGSADEDNIQSSQLKEGLASIAIGTDQVILPCTPVPSIDGPVDQHKAEQGAHANQTPKKIQEKVNMIEAKTDIGDEALENETENLWLDYRNKLLDISQPRRIEAFKKNGLKYSRVAALFIDQLDTRVQFLEEELSKLQKRNQTQDDDK